MAAQNGAAESSQPTGLHLPIAPAPVAAPTFKFKYKEANPAPAGADPSLWNKCFTAADSRLYNNYGKKAEKSQKARASGETRVLALQLLQERLAKAAQSTFASSSTTTTTRPPTPHTIPATTLSVHPSPNPLINPATASTAIHQLFSLETNLHPSTAVKMERSSSHDATQAPFVFGNSPSDATPTKFTFADAPPSIADNVKGKGRTGKRQGAKATSASTSLPGFGPGSLGYAEKRKRDDPQRSELTDAEMTKLAYEKLDTMTLEEVMAVSAWVDENGDIEQTAAATPPVAGENAKISKSKKKREGRKRAAAIKAAEPIPQSPRSPVESDGDDDSSNDGGQYCICRGPDDHRRMIACDACDEWFHCSCVGVKDFDVDLIDKYICLSCEEPGKNTTWKPMCRLQGCRKPCNLAANPPSKYCSDDHRKRWGREQVAKMRGGKGPSRGGALTRGELKAMLDKTKGDVKAFHALGQKPTLPEGSEAMNVEAFMTSEEKGRLVRIAMTRQKHHTAIDGYTDKGKLLRMATARIRKETDGNKDLIGICGWEPLLAMNEEEFLEWRNSEDGKKAFDSGALESTYCDRKHCKTHPAWIKTVSLDINEELARLKKLLEKLRADEQTIHERCKVRAATQKQ